MHDAHSVCRMVNASSAYSGSVVANVKAEIARCGVSQSGVAAALGLSQPQVSRRLSGRVDFSSSEIIRLSDLLGVPVGVFFGEVAAPIASGDAA